METFFHILDDRKNEETAIVGGSMVRIYYDIANSLTIGVVMKSP